MDYFVKEGSIVRTIWGKSDTILFIFAGAAAEFALNKSVDWLFYTGRLPADPIGRLFSTVTYARDIVYSEKNAALKTIDKMSAIHAGVEKSRGMSIPDWAYRDVLYMLIDYSIRAYELLMQTMTDEEKEEVFTVFNNVGTRMGIHGLPDNYTNWIASREQHLNENMLLSEFTLKLFKRYEEQLGNLRYKILLEAQILMVPEQVKEHLSFRSYSMLRPAVPVYKIFSQLKLEGIFKDLLLPSKYKAQIKALDTV